MKKLCIVVVLIVALAAWSAPVMAQSYGANYCHYICNQQYPSPWSPGSVGCHLYCDYYCAQAENIGTQMCMDIQDYYGAIFGAADACAG